MAHLVFQTAFPGDVFLSIPLLKRIKDWDPQTPLVLACRPGLGEFFLRAGLVSEVVEIDKKSSRGRRRALSQLSARKWEHVFVPHESMRTALWMLWVRSSKGKIGFRKWWNFPIYKFRVVKPLDFPDALRQLSLLTPLDGDLAEKFGSDEIQSLVSPTVNQDFQDFRTPRIPHWADMQVRKWSPQGRRIFLAPGSVWNTKRWTLSSYENLAARLLKKEFEVELVGSRDERELCEQIATKVKGVRNRAGETTLSGLVDLLAEGAALVCNDSGAMHAASTIGLPTVAIFGPTVLAQGFRPWQNRAVVTQIDLKCRPCGKHGAQVCPIGTHECMTSLSVDQVMSALERVISYR